MAAPRIFISYSRRDEDLAEDLKARLKVISGDIILKTRKVRPGQAWPVAVLSDLEQADEVLVLLTPNSFDSQFVLIEVGASLGLGKRVVPIVVGLDEATLPAWVRALPFIKYSELHAHLHDLVPNAGAEVDSLDRAAVP